MPCESPFATRQFCTARCGHDETRRSRMLPAVSESRRTCTSMATLVAAAQAHHSDIKPLLLSQARTPTATRLTDRTIARARMRDKHRPARCGNVQRNDDAALPELDPVGNVVALDGCLDRTADHGVQEHDRHTSSDHRQGGHTPPVGERFEGTDGNRDHDRRRPRRRR